MYLEGKATVSRKKNKREFLAQLNILFDVGKLNTVMFMKEKKIGDWISVVHFFYKKSIDKLRILYFIY